MSQLLLSIPKGDFEKQTTYEQSPFDQAKCSIDSLGLLGDQSEIGPPEMDIVSQEYRIYQGSRKNGPHKDRV